MITEEMISKWREEFERQLKGYGYPPFEKNGHDDYYLQGGINREWSSFLSAKESSQEEIDERDELIKKAVVCVEAIRAINNLPGYRVGDGEKQFKEWLSKAKTILGEK